MQYCTVKSFCLPCGSYTIEVGRPVIPRDLDTHDPLLLHMHGKESKWRCSVQVSESHCFV